MKCSCGAYKVYGAASGSPLHSDWCDTRKSDHDAPGEALSNAARPWLVSLSHVKAAPQVQYCTWMHRPSNQKPAVKIVRYGNHLPMYACQDCLDTGQMLAKSGIGGSGPIYEWDLNDPHAPAVP